MLSLIKHDNAGAVIIKLLKQLKINSSHEVIINELEKHPGYPSLLAISDVLTCLGIENSAYRLEPDEIDKIPYPFIAHTLINNGDFVLIDKIETETVQLYNEKRHKHNMKLADFRKIYSGVVLTVEIPDISLKSIITSPSVTYLKLPFIITSVLFILVASLLFYTSYFANYTWQVLTLTLFKSLGLVTSVLLLIQSIDSNNPLIQKLCQSNSKTNCNAILSSKAAKVPIWIEGLTWSEVGFFYFAGTWLALLFGGHSVSLIQVLAVLNIFSLPYTFYSIYYQARVAKQWCILCCTVQALLWLEFIPGVTAFNSPFTMPHAGELSTLFIALLSPVILWVIIKPLLLKLQQLKPLKDQLRKFKYNAELFHTMLKDQPKYAQPDDSWCIVLGNAEANNCITMVTNPYCPPCSKTHKLLDELLDQNDNVQARIVFTANNTDSDKKTPVSRHLMALNELPDKTIIKKALHDWYEQKQKSYEAWAKVYPVQLNEAEYYKIDRQKAWCDMAEVTATPTLLLNGHRLPDLYQLPDLKYMLQ